MKNPHVLKQLRQKVETIDEEIVGLLAMRFKIASEIQIIKRKNAMPIYQKKRENSLMRRYIALAAKKNVPASVVKRLFASVFYYSKKTGIIKR